MLELNLENMSIEKLNEYSAQILSKNAHWKTCQDGSYEMALSHSPYYSILEEIKKREES